MTDGPLVGVVGDETATVEAAVRAAGGRPETGPADALVGDAALLVAVGDDGMLDLARAAPESPLLPVAVDRGLHAVPRDRAEAAIRAFLGGDFETRPHPLVAVAVADARSATVLRDVMLASAEPAQISEYTVRTDEERVGTVRADGVVVATPAGSAGYARAAGGPVLAPGTDVVAVVPVAPFATDPDHWVVPLEGLSLTVERDDTENHVVADDRVVGGVDPDETVSLSRAGTVEVAVVSQSAPPFHG